MQIEGLSWFPGHMTKTKRMIVAEIKNMDAVCEIVDARIPISSRNPDVDEMTAGKPRLMVLNRVDQADPAQTKRWAAYFRQQGYAVLEANAKGGVAIRLLNLLWAANIAASQTWPSSLSPSPIRTYT